MYVNQLGQACSHKKMFSHTNDSFDTVKLKPVNSGGDKNNDLSVTVTGNA